MKTLYAVVCEKKSKDREFLGIVGLFKNKENAEKAVAFWNESAFHDVIYGIHNITTDL